MSVGLTQVPNTLNLNQESLDIGFPRPREHGEGIAMAIAKLSGIKFLAPRLYRRAETLFSDLRTLHDIVSQESASPDSNPKQESENWEKILSKIMGGTPIKLVSNEEAILKRNGQDDVGQYTQVAWYQDGTFYLKYSLVNPRTEEIPASRRHRLLAVALSYLDAAREVQEKPNGFRVKLLRGVAKRLGLQDGDINVGAAFMLSGTSLKRLKRVVEATRNLSLFPAIELDVILGRFKSRSKSITLSNLELLRNCFDGAKDIYGARDTSGDKSIRHFSFCTRVADTLAHLGLPPTVVAAGLLTKATEGEMLRIGYDIERASTSKLFQDAMRLARCAREVANLPFFPSDSQRNNDTIAQRWQDLFNGYCKRIASENRIDEASLKYLACVINHQSMALASTQHAAHNLEILEKKLRLLIAPVVERDCRGVNRPYSAQITHDIFRQCRPDDYLRIRNERREVMGMGHSEIKEFCKNSVRALERALEAIGITNFTVTYREKSYDSIAQKQGARFVGIQDQEDLIGFRIVVPTRDDFDAVLKHDIVSVVGKKSDREARVDPLGNIRLNVSIPAQGSAQSFRAEINIRTSSYQVKDDEGSEKILPHYGMVASKSWRRWGFVPQVSDRQDREKTGNLENDVPQVSQGSSHMVQVLVPESFGSDLSPGKIFRSSFKIIELPRGSTVADLLCHSDIGKTPQRHSALLIGASQLSYFSTEIRLNSVEQVPSDHVLETGEILVARPISNKSADIAMTNKGLLSQIVRTSQAHVRLGSSDHQGRAKLIRRGISTLSDDFGDLSTPEIKRALTQFAERWGFSSLDDLFVGLSIWKTEVSNKPNSLRRIAPSPDDIKRELSHRFVRVGVDLDTPTKSLTIDFDEDQVGLFANTLRCAESLGIEISSAGTASPKEGYENRVYLYAADATEEELLGLKQKLKSICVQRDRANKLRIAPDTPKIGLTVSLLNEKGSLLAMTEKLASLNCLIENLKFLNAPTVGSMYYETYGTFYLEIKSAIAAEFIKKALMELEFESPTDSGTKSKHCIGSVEINAIA